ncbi:Sorting nexin C terminal [Nesidiocoris tenuis]|uniref:Sorting nexin C terminal n=1 Tax=Nesidiocoris tenuis TaxID=355587 RepID=A0ABN7ANQ6_9HEMI|nr:Sorting nexin C terminal [Nesidiocoris tenuis]
MLSSQAACWAFLVIALFVSTFGLAFCIVFIISILLFLLGIATTVYWRQTKSLEDYLGLESLDYAHHMYEVVEKLRAEKTILKADKRLTGSHVIDEQLQEILDFVIRDFVYPWYDQVSDNEEIPHEIRVAIQNVIVGFSNRVKEADWIPFLTTQIVDDAASHLKLYRQARTRLKAAPSNSKLTLEDAFFDLEIAMENGKVCRDHLCMNPTSQRCYLQQLTDIILFYLSPELEFHCLSLRYLTREIIVNSVLLPILSKLSDPDYINQVIIYLCKDFPVTSETFMAILKTSDVVDELTATKEILNKEISTLRSRDAGGVSESTVKMQLSSLNYLGKLVDTQIARLQSGLESGVDYSHLLLSSSKLFQLPLDVLLKNNIALHYFMEHMRSVNQHPYLFFHLNIEGWKASTEQQLADLEQNTSFDKADVMLAEQYSAAKQSLERIREAASSIFEQYLTEQSSNRLMIDELVVKRLLYRIQNEKPHENWFDEAQACVLDKMQNDERCLIGFRSTSSYVKLLSELDLLRGDSSLVEGDEEDSGSLDRVSLNSDTASLPEFVIGASDCTVDSGSSSSPGAGSKDDKPSGTFTLYAEIIETGLVHEKGKTFGVYAVSVSKKYESGHRESWHIYRRYSDFYELHQKIKEKFPELSKLSFPAKKTFGNMERKTLERRMMHLNNYLRSLFTPGVLASKPGLIPILLYFLGPTDYRQTSNFSSTLDSLFRMSMQAVRTVPDSVMSSVDGMVDNLSKVLQVRTVGKEGSETAKVGASLDAETDDNIPMRIMLLLMTEVFELRASSQWLRKRLITFLRQIVRTMFGDIVNRRILDYVSFLTSPNKVASYLSAFKESLWPNGFPSEPTMPRDHATKMRTRVAAKAALLSSLPDDIKHILGSQTTLTGITTVFSLLQITRLNTRFCSVVLEGVLTNIFPGVSPALMRLHAKSERLNPGDS